MPAFTHPGVSLAVVFHRQGEPDDRRVAVDGSDAVYVAMRVLAEQHELLIGDRVTVEADAGLPAVSLSAQHG
jgi:hypothetical protein